MRNAGSMDTAMSASPAGSPPASPLADASGIHHVSKKTRTLPPATSSSTLAFQVLTNPKLWGNITTIMDGIPWLVREFIEYIREGGEDEKSKYNVDPFRRDKFPRGNGFFTHAAIIENNTKVLKMIGSQREALHRFRKLQSCDVVRCAVAHNRLELLKWLVQSLTADPTWEWEVDLMKTAVTASCDMDGNSICPDLELLEWLDNNCPSDSIKLTGDDIAHAAGCGRLEVVRWIHEHNYAFTVKAMDLAATNGHLEVVQFLHENRSEGCGRDAMNGAAANGYYDIVKFLHENRAEGCSMAAMDRAAKNGNFPIIQFLHENRPEGCTRNAMDGAAGNGFLEIVKFLHENRTEGCSTRAMDDAADNGHLEVLKFLHANRMEGFSDRGTKWKARNTYLEMVQFLHEHHPTGFSAATMDCAAAEGDLDVVRFLHDNREEGCTTNAIDLAAAGGHLEVVKFLHENRTEGCSILALRHAMEEGHEEVVKFLYVNRYKNLAPRSL
uniref:Uncharacterized protein n=1 Tax=Globisporangium ultimum (strain ATCC 200006 / CBS 805.95 / DAOM BR144) TaxID=431595 RepID=K3X6W6_GLOUD